MASSSDTLCSKIELRFVADGLRTRDVLSKSDPYVELHALNHNQIWEILGKTEVIKNDEDPKWTTTFMLDYHFEQIQKFKALVFDYDSKKTSDFLGEVSFTLGRVMGSLSQTLCVPLTKPTKESNKARGKLSIHGKAITGRKSVLNFRLRAHKLDKKDWGGFRASDPFYLMSSIDGAESHSVTRSNHVKNSSNPIWNADTVSGNNLFNGDPGKRFKIQVFDHDGDGSHDLIGEVILSIKDITVGEKIPIVHPPTKPKYRKSSYKNSGYIEFMSLVHDVSPDFLEYVEGGCQMSLDVAIDFTASNGDPNSLSSLHSTNNGGVLNSYEHAIKAVGEILQEYDHDKLFPVYGFGAKIPVQHGGSVVSHCFSVNGSAVDARVEGVQGILNAYKECLHRVSLCGPTNFADVIRRATQMAFNPEISSRSQSYTTLLILTDGVISDIRATIDAIVDASEHPLSIVIVGIGDADFSAMGILDGDEARLVSSSGKTCARDCVQFVPFNAAVQRGSLMKDVLGEIPDHVVDFFHHLKGVPPMANNATDDFNHLPVAKVHEAGIPDLHSISLGSSVTDGKMTTAKTDDGSGLQDSQSVPMATLF